MAADFCSPAFDLEAAAGFGLWLFDLEAAVLTGFFTDLEAFAIAARFADFTTFADFAVFVAFAGLVRAAGALRADAFLACLRAVLLKMGASKKWAG